MRDRLCRLDYRSKKTRDLSYPSLHTRLMLLGRYSCWLLLSHILYGKERMVVKIFQLLLHILENCRKSKRKWPVFLADLLKSIILERCTRVAYKGGLQSGPENNDDREPTLKDIFTGSYQISKHSDHVISFILVVSHTTVYERTVIEDGLSGATLMMKYSDVIGP